MKKQKKIRARPRIIRGLGEKSKTIRARPRIIRGLGEKSKTIRARSVIIRRLGEIAKNQGLYQLSLFYLFQGSESWMWEIMDTCNAR